jgi:hypothetical protein
VERWALRLADLLEEDPAAEADLRALVEGIRAVLPAGVVSATDHAVAAGRDWTISASRGGIAAGVIHGNMAPPDPVETVHQKVSVVGGEVIGIKIDSGADVQLGRRVGAGGADARSGGHGGGCGGDDDWGPPAGPRYLVGQCPERVAVDKPFSLLASIKLASSPASAELEPFDVPSEARMLCSSYTPLGSTCSVSTNRPVTRAIFGWRPGHTLRLQPVRFVLPEGSLHEAAVEVEAMRRLLDSGQAPSAVIRELTPLRDLIGSGEFGLLHFACHNTYEPVGGSSIRLGRVRFTPTLLEVAAIQKALRASAPTVFINACRSAGLAATYNRLDSWASKFLEAGAAAFIGSLWAVSDGASREFAEELYRRLQLGFTLGEAVREARRAAASQPDDPTWLAYTVYGDPRATIDRSQMMVSMGEGKP